MVKDYAKKRKKKKTRLTKIEERKAIKQAVFYIFLTIMLVLLLIFVGIPVIIRLAVFLGELGSSNVPVEKSDQLAPPPPTLQPTDQATNSASFSISGYSESGALVKIILNGEPEKEVVTDNSGKFTAQNLTLEEGENTLKAQTIDKANNKSDYSKTISIVFDQKPPELEITNPKDGDKFFDEERQITISGETDKNATVEINNRLAVIDQYGNFSQPYELNEGENKLKIVATDPAGNQTSQEITVSYTK